MPFNGKPVTELIELIDLDGVPDSLEKLKVVVGVMSAHIKPLQVEHITAKCSYTSRNIARISQKCSSIEQIQTPRESEI